MRRGWPAAGFALAVALAVVVGMFVITGMPARAGLPTDNVTVTETATVTDSAIETVTESTTETATATATRSVFATDTKTAHRTTTRLIPLPGSTITRTLPGGVVVTTVVATPTSAPATSTFAAQPGDDVTAPTSAKSLWSLWPYLLAMLVLVLLGVGAWAVTSGLSLTSRGSHR